MLGSVAIYDEINNDKSSSKLDITYLKYTVLLSKSMILTEKYLTLFGVCKSKFFRIIFCCPIAIAMVIYCCYKYVVKLIHLTYSRQLNAGCGWFPLVRVTLVPSRVYLTWACITTSWWIIETRVLDAGHLTAPARPKALPHSCLASPRTPASPLPNSCLASPRLLPRLSQSGGRSGWKLSHVVCLGFDVLAWRVASALEQVLSKSVCW